MRREPVDLIGVEPCGEPGTNRSLLLFVQIVPVCPPDSQVFNNLSSKQTSSQQTGPRLSTDTQTTLIPKLQG